MNAASVANAAVLTSWKDIARYMGKGVRTVQRWEQDFGLPVRRPHGSNKKAILARPSDLDVWVAMRCSMSERHQEKGGSSVLATRTSLSAGMETARMLRNSQKELRIELRAAIAALQKQLLRLREYKCGTQDGFVQPAGPWVDQTPQPLGTPDVITLALPSPVLDGSSPMPVSRGNLHAMRASEDPSSIRFPEAMGA